MTNSLPTDSPPPQRLRIGRVLLYALIVGSFLVNILMCLTLNAFRFHSEEITERHYSGEEGSKSRIAVIRIEGVLMEGMTHHFIKQIEQVAKDDKVKAVVIRIDSPGGTISAADELHRLLTQLRDGKLRRFPDSKPKKMVVSMGAIAASGGYYIAMPAERIFAEPTCITGSIGVYASLPNVADLIDRNGIKFELVKAGAIKASGSPFHQLTPQEREPWQVMVDSAYDRFLDTVETGRKQIQPPIQPALTKDALRNEVVVNKKIPLYDGKGRIETDWWGRPVMVDYVRQRADGGTFTADEALKLHLIDEIGDLDSAIDAVAASAQLSKYEVVMYDQPSSFLSSMLGMRAKQSNALDPQRLANGMSPRLWYLAPQADLAGILTALAKE